MIGEGGRIEAVVSVREYLAAGMALGIRTLVRRDGRLSGRANLCMPIYDEVMHRMCAMGRSGGGLLTPKNKV